MTTQGVLLRSGALFLLLTSSACGIGSEGLPVPASVRDSAGVRIVEHPGGFELRPVTLELIWEHGHGPDDYPFRLVFLGALQPDGGAVLSDGGNREVVSIGPGGRTHRVLAATGEGPSEVSRPRAVLASGRSGVWVEDPGNAKLIRFEGGALVNTIRTSGVANRMMPVAEDVSGELLMITSAYRSDFEQPWLDGHIARFDPLRVTLDPTEAMWIEFEAYLREDLERVNPRMSPDRLEEFLDERVERYSVDRSVPLPLFGRIVGSTDGAVWLPAFSPRGARSSRYVIVTDGGTRVGAALFPRPFSVVAADGTHVLGSFVDELDVQAVAVYRYTLGS